MPITKIRKEPKVSASNVNVSPGQQLDDALTAIGAALDAKANAADVAAVTGNRSNLNTTDKSNLVAAINEVNDNIPTSYNELTDKPIVKTSDNGFVIVANGANRANKATAQNAFAEGGKTEAAGTSSHAEGYVTLAEGSASHTEGQGTQAVGTSSHAEGLNTLARGAYSHVEGNYTETVDSSAHAEGYNTAAYGIASHAEGHSMWSNRVVSRAYTAGDSYLYVKREVYPGYVITSDTQTIGVQNCVLQEQDEDYRLTLDTPFTEDFAVDGILAIAPSAYGSYSHREGEHTVAMGTASHAEGNLSKALGDYSHAEGQATETQNFAEHASGKYNKSTPSVTQFSVGIGADEEHRTNAYEVTTDGKMYVKGVGGYDGTNVSDSSVDDLATAISQAGGVTDYDDLKNKPIFQKEGEDGWVLGDLTDPDCPHAYDDNSFAEGWGTIAGDPSDETYGYAAHAEGDRTQAISQGSHSEGSLTQAQGPAAHAEGLYSIASGGDSHAEGFFTKATTPHSHTEGDHSETHGLAAHAEGNTTKANGAYSHSEGDTTIANGDAAHAEGKSVTASGDYSHAEGTTTTASGEASHAEGSETTASSLYSHAEGDGSTANGEASHAEGRESRALGTYSHAEGRYTVATGAQSHAGGYGSNAEGENSHAEGYYTTALSNNGFVCGTWNFPDSTTLFAVGCGTSPNPKDAVHVDYDGNVYIQGIGNYDGTNIGQSGVESVQEVIARLVQALGGNNS